MKTLAAQTSDAWIAFARTGNPNHKGAADLAGVYHGPTRHHGVRCTGIQTGERSRDALSGSSGRRSVDTREGQCFDAITTGSLSPRCCARQQRGHNGRRRQQLAPGQTCTLLTQANADASAGTPNVRHDGSPLPGTPPPDIASGFKGIPRSAQGPGAAAAGAGRHRSRPQPAVPTRRSRSSTKRRERRCRRSGFLLAPAAPAVVRSARCGRDSVAREPCPMTNQGGGALLSRLWFASAVAFCLPALWLITLRDAYSADAGGDSVRPVDLRRGVRASWAAEVAQMDMSQVLATAILALIAVLPEYAVDFISPGAQPKTPCTAITLPPT